MPSSLAESEDESQIGFAHAAARNLVYDGSYDMESVLADTRAQSLAR